MDAIRFRHRFIEDWLAEIPVESQEYAQPRCSAYRVTRNEEIFHSVSSAWRLFFSLHSLSGNCNGEKDETQTIKTLARRVPQRPINRVQYSRPD